MSAALRLGLVGGMLAAAAAGASGQAVTADAIAKTTRPSSPAQTGQAPPHGMVVQGSAVALAGRMGDRALLVIDGKPHAVAVGASVSGVRLLRWADDTAQVQVRGQLLALRVGESPAQLGAPPPRLVAREIVLSAGPGGHFTTLGAINGKPARFMVDTGATLVSLGQDQAQRLGLDLSGARAGVSQTANGPVSIQIITLDRVRVGEVEVTNVGAAVVPHAMPYLLLGNSFLNRFQMQRHSEELRLQLR
jgi:aspartyl protease family protein